MRKNAKLVMALLKKGLKQTDLRELAGFRSEARLSRIINGRETPTALEIERICTVLGKAPKSWAWLYQRIRNELSPSTHNCRSLSNRGMGDDGFHKSRNFPTNN